MKKKLIAALMITAMTAAAAGCGGQSSGTAGETSETSAAGAGETTDSQEAEETAAQDEASDSQDEKTEGGEAAADGESYTIGIGQYAVHGSLDNCREGFLLGLAEAGIEEGKNLTVLYENANGDGGMSTQIVSNFLSQDADLICAIATPMAQTAYGATKRTDVPVIYTAVTDPVIAQLAGEDKMPAGNITGTSDKLPVGIASTFRVLFWPSFITAPLPNCFSIWPRAVSKAFLRSSAETFERRPLTGIAFFSAMLRPPSL